ncbi:MAG: DUF4388 domain-containing protein [Candidatus Latescibacteria bacterium]|nr:DUF4388 domain-containing protein [bacterium]MBD3423313.1 DUF4388 domain-containing protein [Candidatus Latescibacterota bacterium]
MGFEGDVKDFGLSEIFQLISVQQKSGMLLVSGEGNIAVFFSEGMIISTRDRRNRSMDPLKEYMIRYGFLSKKVLDKINRIQDESKLDLTDILISEKYFSEDELMIIFRDQIYETIQEAINWPRSHYKFISGKNLVQGVKSFASIKVDAVLMESMRRIDEFPRLLEQFPSIDMILERKSDPGREIPELSGNQEFIYELLRDRMNLGQVISNGKMARFSVYDALSKLLEADLLQVTMPSEKPQPVARERSEIPPERSPLVPILAIAAVLIISFLAGEYLIPAVLQPGWPVITGDGKEALAGSGLEGITRIRAGQLEKKITTALEEYRASRGSYPLTIEILSLKGFVNEDTVKEAKDFGYRYRLRNNSQSFTLERGAG